LNTKEKKYVDLLINQWKDIIKMLHDHIGAEYEIVGSNLHEMYLLKLINVEKDGDKEYLSFSWDKKSNKLCKNYYNWSVNNWPACPYDYNCTKKGKPFWIFTHVLYRRNIVDSLLIDVATNVLRSIERVGKSN